MTAPGRPGDPERRLADLLDRQDISALLVRFARCLDTKDFTGYADCYAPEGVLQLPGGGHEGRAGMADYVERDLGGYVATHHVSANHEIEIDDDTARARSSLHATHVRSTEDDFWSVGGWYDTTLRRTPEGWRFTRVSINPVWRFDTRQFP
ncbi:MAG: nuclear transport factor 2 family protein [Pseudonocardiales bacterium]